MKRLIVISIAAILFSGPTYADDIYALIHKGKLSQARDLISKSSTASTRDGNMLFYQSLIEPEADNAARLMEAALGASVMTRYTEDIYFRLAQFYLIEKNYKKLAEVLAEYQSRWPDGKRHGEMMRLSLFLDLKDRKFETALHRCDDYLVRYAEGASAQWGRIDKARILHAYGKKIGATRLLRRLSREKSGIGIPQALYMLGIGAASEKRVDDAVFFYNLFREAYPSAIGLDDLVVQLGGMSSGSTSDNAAEKLTGTFYSIKVGVFSNSGNAKRQADKFKVYDQKVQIKSKDISGQKYHVVYVGHFQDYQQAARFKIQLEAAHNEQFQVVTR